MRARRPRKDPARLDETVAAARRAADARRKAYREQALKRLPWVCGRCGRSFTPANVHELTVHHRDHDHDHNPPDGSNWELLCLYCHENEHRRRLDAAAGGTAHTAQAQAPATGKPLSGLKEMLKPRRP